MYQASAIRKVARKALSACWAWPVALEARQHRARRRRAHAECQHLHRGQQAVALLASCPSRSPRRDRVHGRELHGIRAEQRPRAAARTAGWATAGKLAISSASAQVLITAQHLALVAQRRAMWVTRAWRPCCPAPWAASSCRPAWGCGQADLQHQRIMKGMQELPRRENKLPSRPTRSVSTSNSPGTNSGFRAAQHYAANG